LVTERSSLLTPPQVRRLLVAHGIAPRKSAGQNFVVDPNTVRKIVRDAQVQTGDLVVEIGPGLGSLTLALHEAGAFVLAVEIDQGLVRVLDETVGSQPAVRVVHADALRVDWRAELIAARTAWGPGGPGEGPARLVANLPYHVATPLLFHALEAQAFATMLLMVQKEVGQRWVAGPGDAQYGAVSVKVASVADARIVAQVSRQAFYPVPNVDSVTVGLTPVPWQWDVPRPALWELVEAGFAQRRKRLRNALGARGHAPGAVEAALVAAGLDPGARGEELGLAQWLRLAAVLLG
jgi:16S rRNA (adenine1518-N6/adenine1519-N6)-dimethyltransferase